MASRTLLSASSRVRPCEMQPGNDGTSATKTPSSSCSINTRNFMFSPSVREGASRSARPKERLDLPALDGGEVLKELFDGVPALKVVDQGVHWHACSREDQVPAVDLAISRDDLCQVGVLGSWLAHRRYSAGVQPYCSAGRRECKVEAAGTAREELWAPWASSRMARPSSPECAARNAPGSLIAA